MRVAAIQTTAGPDRDANLAAAGTLVGQAASEGATLVVLPEYFSVAGSPGFLRSHAEDADGPTATWASQLAGGLGIYLLAGSVPLRPDDGGTQGGTHGSNDDRLANTSLLYGPDGELLAAYRKIHLFDVDLATTSFCESATVAPGDEVCVVPLGAASGQVLGLSICYDLRFPELYRILALRGATVVAVPSAFTAATGPAHWELLLRARAVEDQVFVIGAGQVGDLPPGMPPCHGHSMIVDPWGTILAERTHASPGVVVADLDSGLQDEVRARIPALANRRPDAYRWPDERPQRPVGPDR